MLFNSIDFIVFLPCVFILYWLLFFKSFQLQNLFLIIASYIFYGWWDWRFLTLIIISSATDYIIGLVVGRLDSQKMRRMALGLSVVGI